LDGDVLSYDEYSTGFESVAMTRQDGVLEATLHTHGDSLRWGLLAHRELAEAFRCIADDRENRIVLLTGSGAEFCGPRATAGNASFADHPDAATWERSAFTEARQLISALLDIAVPVVGVVNGPALRHGELALLSDIVIASDDATFEDSAHFQLQEYVPGDGVHVVYTMLLGINRARHFLLTGEVIDAAEAKRLGMVAEVLPKDQALVRGRELACQIAKKPDLLLRYTRALLVHPIKRQMLDLLSLGLAVEGYTALGRDTHPLKS
jgi:enoyl-CoA hydratase/carnithine racemase